MSEPQEDWTCMFGVRNCSSCKPPEHVDSIKEDLVYPFGEIRMAKIKGVLWKVSKENRPLNKLKNQHVALPKGTYPIGMVKEAIDPLKKLLDRI